MAKHSKELDDNRPADAEEVLEQHDAAKSIYSGALQKSKEAQELIENTYEIPADVVDSGTARVSQVVRSRAVLEKFRQMIQVDTIEFTVMPLGRGDKERSLCSKLERELVGVDQRLKWETKRDHDRDAAWWYVLRGQAIYEVRFKPEYKDTKKFPIRIYTPDPNTIFPVRGMDEIMYYTKEYEVTGRELKRAIKADGKDSAWIEKDNDPYCCVEYWDDTYHAMVCKDNEEEKGRLLYSKKHGYGFIPLSVGRCMDTPMSSAEWSYNSVISPVVDSLKQVYILMSKVAVGVNFNYYPLILYFSQDGRPIVFNPATNTGADLVPMMPGSKIEVLNPTPNAQILNQLLSFHLSDISLMTIPDISFGSEPQNLQSGFAVSQVMSAVTGAIKDKLPELQRAAGDCRGNVLRLIDQFASGSGFDFRVPMDFEE